MSEEKPKKKSVYVVLMILGALLVGILIADLFIYRFKQGQKILGAKKNTGTITQEQANAEAKSVVDEVKKLMDVPQGEEPTVATITDINKLKDQQFFSQAKNGDKVIVYTKAQKAILYDPVAKKIIDVAPVNISSSSAQESSDSGTLSP